MLQVLHRISRQRRHFQPKRLGIHSNPKGVYALYSKPAVKHREASKTSMSSQFSILTLSGERDHPILIRFLGVEDCQGRGFGHSPSHKLQLR